MPKTCVVCGEAFEPYRERNRCCSRECSAAYFADEHRHAVRFYRQHLAERASTYHQMAQADAELGGRYAATAQVHVTGTGGEAPLASPSWSRDLAALPDEPPTGEDINAMEGQ